MSQQKRKADDISSEGDPTSTWSIGPSDNFFDWIVEVRNKETDTVTSYHVHRVFLARGSRSSEYFQGVFRNKGMKESNENVTRVELDGRMADAFPVMLDYIYTGTFNYVIKEKRLDIMQRDVKSGAMEALVTLYNDASSLAHDDTLCAIADTMSHCDEMVLLFRGKRLLEAIAPEFFLRLKLDPDSCDYVIWKDILFIFCLIHCNDLDGDLFSKLYNTAYGPADDPNSITCELWWIKEFIELAKKCPKIKGFPTDLQKRFIGPLHKACALDIRDCELKYVMDDIWESLDVVNEMPSVDEEVLDMVRDSLVMFFEKYPKEMENLFKDKVCLPIFVKLFAGMQKQRREMREEHDKEVEALKSEIRQLRLRSKKTIC